MRYLFGPTGAPYDQWLMKPRREAGECLLFGPGPSVDIDLPPEADWNSVCTQFPAGWQPDFLVLSLMYGSPPRWTWDVPVPIVALAGDWNLLWHGHRARIPWCDLILTDVMGVERLARDGVRNVHAANLFGVADEFLFRYGATDRDIDILFVGNFSPAVQSERLLWLSRIACVHANRHIVFASGVFGEEYRKLLARAKIVFNRSIRGEWNCRVLEAIGAGALLFQEDGNLEIEPHLRAGQDYVAYNAENLDDLLNHYLDHADEREQIAHAAHSRAAAFRHDSLWARQLELIEREFPAIRRERKRATAIDRILADTWQFLSSSMAFDVGDSELQVALNDDPRNVVLWNCRGVRQALCRNFSEAAAAFQEAWLCDPRCTLSGLNLAETLLALGQKQNAVDQARRTLRILEGERSFPLCYLNVPPWTRTYDHFRVQWERAAWQSAGNAGKEADAKTILLRWRLHQLLAGATTDLAHWLEAASCRPDLAPTVFGLGQAYAQQGHAELAVRYLERALELAPFDRVAAKTLYQVLGGMGNVAAQKRLAHQWRSYAKAAPTIAPLESWAIEGGIVQTTTTMHSDRRFRIRWEGEMNAVHSFAVINRELCPRLLERGHQLTVFSGREQPENDTNGRSQFRQPLTAPAEFHVAHQWPPRFEPPAEGHWVIMQPWEYGSLPRVWVGPLCNEVDEVWVPSRFVRNAFLQAGVSTERVHVIPFGVSPQLMGDHSKPFGLKTKKRFRFLFVGGTIQRKGIDLLLLAYRQAFSDKDDVCLVIKDMGGRSFYRDQTAIDQIEEFRRQRHAPEIEYLDQDMSPTELASLYAACDCLVHPYRGEGFGLPIVEAMANGLPVIVTAFGPSLDYCDGENAYLVPARAVPFSDKRVGEFETVDVPFLAQPDMDSLRAFMRRVVHDPEDAIRRGEKAKETIRSHFTWDHTIAAMETRLTELAAKPILRQPRAKMAPGPVATIGSSKKTVSLCMIVKNEEHNLAACLSSVRDIVDEIVVVDTGSNDRTREIALEHGAKVFDFPWVDSFAAARNESLRHASCDWIFWMDADDRLDAEQREHLRRTLKGLDDRYLGYVMKCLCLPDPEADTATVVDHVRLFRNHPDIRWKYRIHEQILPAIRRLHGEVTWSDVVVHHVGYQDRSVRARKLERDIRLLRLEDNENPNDPFTLFNLGSVYQEMGKLDDALPCLQRSLILSHTGDSIVRKLYATIGQCYRHLGRPQEALDTCQTGRRHYPEDVELLFQESLVRREIGDLAGAESCLLRLLDSKDGQHFASVDTGLRGYKAHHNLAIIYQDQKQLNKAEHHWCRALAENPDFVPAHLGLADVFLAQGMLEEVMPCLQFLQRHPHHRFDAEMLTAKLRLAEKNWTAAKSLLRRLIDKAPQELAPRVLLSHALLREGKSWDEAERALRDILQLDPENKEARHNLETLQNNRADM